MGRKSTSGLPYLIVRPDSGKYVYNRVVAADIAAYVVGEIGLPWSGGSVQLSGKTSIKISLKTGDDVLARKRWAMIDPQIDALVQLAVLRVRKDARAAETLSHITGLSPTDIRTLAEQKRSDVLSEHDREWLDPNFETPLTTVIRKRMAALLSPSQQNADRARRLARELETNHLSAALKERNPGVADRAIKEMELDVDPALFSVHPTADEIKAKTAYASPEQMAALGMAPIATTTVAGMVDQALAGNGVAIAAGHPDRRAAALALLRAELSARSDIEARDTGKPIATPARPALSPSIVDETPTVSEMLRLWLGLKKRSAKTAADAKLYVGRFIALRGDLKINAVTKRDISAFRETLAKFPRNVPDELKAMPPLEIVAWAEAHPDCRRLGRRTVNEKAIGCLSKLIAKAVDEGHADRNPCKNMKFELGANDIVERKPFAINELQTLFHTPVYQSPAARPRGGAGEAAYWLPLLALFTGGRQEELGQLLTADVAEEAGIPFINITTLDDDEQAARPSKTTNQANGNAVSADKSIKTEAGIRRIPIHRELVKLGFLAYVAERRNAGDRRLFPDLKPYKGRLTKNWGRWWARYQDEHVTAAEDKVFHSFRHNFISALAEARPSDLIFRMLIGHSRTEQARIAQERRNPILAYTHTSLEQLNEAIQKISYPGLDLTHLYPAASNSVG